MHICLKSFLSLGQSSVGKKHKVDRNQCSEAKTNCWKVIYIGCREDKRERSKTVCSVGPQSRSGQGSAGTRCAYNIYKKKLKARARELSKISSFHRMVDEFINKNFFFK